MKPVMITTKHRGVFFGYLENGLPYTLPGEIELQNCRNCVYRSSDCKGFVGLAVTGPTENCRIGPAVGRITLYDVTAILDVTPEAKEKWELAPWK